MSASELAEVIGRSHHALDAFMKGDPSPALSLFSRRDDVTLANPFGPPACGWDAVAKMAEHAASHYREGEAVGFERVSGYETPDLAYIVELESYRSKVGGAEEITPLALRVTTVFRREEEGWRIVHRHADPITSARQANSVLGS
jgi:ketosteroid isomerase-like protein